MEKRSQKAQSPESGVIEASVQNVRIKRRRRKKYKAKDRSNISILKAKSSLKSLIKETTPIKPTPIKRESSISLVEENLSTKCSIPLFSLESSLSVPESAIFSGIENFISSALSTTFNSQDWLHSPLNDSWDDLSTDITPSQSKDHSQQQYVSQKDQSSQSSFDRVTLDQALESPVHHTNFELPADMSTHDLSQSDETDSQIKCDISDEVNNNDVWATVHERLTSQSINQNYLYQQNQNISIQLIQFEKYVKEVRDKVAESSEYMKQKLKQIVESNLEVVKTLNDVKRDKTIRINEIVPKHSVFFVMPKIPMSRNISLDMLNDSLEDIQNMEQFVSEVSRVVKLHAYKPRKSIKSIMANLFSLNLLAKYTWSKNTSVSDNRPAFSSLSNILTALNSLVTNHMSCYQMRREMKELFDRIPQIYAQQNNKTKHLVPK